MEAVRSQLINSVWPGGELPISLMPDSVFEEVGIPYDLRDLDLNISGISSIKRIESTGGYLQNRQYLLSPSIINSHNDTLVILHQGHGQNTDEYFYGNFPDVANGLLAEGYCVNVMAMPLQGWHRDYGATYMWSSATNQQYTDIAHQDLVDSYMLAGLSPYTPFVEPVEIAINYFISENPDYDTIAMTGLSGGGWTTELAAAMDTRIRLSFPVAGSRPIPLPGGSGTGEGEQPLPGLYPGLTYLDLYALSGLGANRSAIKMNNRYDAIFNGTVDIDNYTPYLENHVAELGGDWTFVLDEVAVGHMISSYALNNVILPKLTAKQPLPFTGKLTAGDTGTGDYYGIMSAIDTDTALVGAPGKSGWVGAAYVYGRNQGGAGNWGEVKKITASDAGGGYGQAVSISGDTILIGAYSAGGTGAAYVHYRDQDGADNWGQVKKITPSDAISGDMAGYTAVVNGDTAVVGALLHNSGAGAAYIYYRDQGGANNWGEVKKIMASDAAAGEWFSVSMSLDVDTLVVGSDGYSTNKMGAVYVFERDQGGTDNWGEVVKLVPDDVAAGDRFGEKVWVSGDTIMVGTPFDDDVATDAGAVYVFERNEGGADNWGQVAKLTADNGANGDTFGYSLALDGDLAVIGAYEADEFGTNAGKAYVFQRNGMGTWNQISQITSSDIASGDRFGYFTALSGDTALLTALNASLGSAYIFNSVRPIPGDANGDGQVDEEDATILAGNWHQMNGATWKMGDFNGDEKVDDIDATLLAANWLRGHEQTTASVPESPTSNILLLILFAVLCSSGQNIPTTYKYKRILDFCCR